MSFNSHCVFMCFSDLPHHKASHACQRRQSSFRQLLKLHICVHQPFFRGPNGIRLFGARIRDPNGTEFRGPKGPNRTTFRGPGLLAVHVSLGVLWRPPFLCPPAIFSGPKWYTTFRGPNPGPEWNSVSGPESGPYNRTTFRGPGLLAAHVSLGALWRPPFQSAHLCSPAFFSRPEWYTTFRGPNPGPELFGAQTGAQIEQLFGARGSWLWMFQRFFEARTGSFFLWRLNALCKLDLKLDLPVVEPFNH